MAQSVDPHLSKICRGAHRTSESTVHQVRQTISSGRDAHLWIAFEDDQSPGEAAVVAGASWGP